MMKHPNIANIMDVGKTTAGRPYFAMELIRGQPITEYCNIHKLSVQERLHLFVSVCHAVQHAHRKGMIHRDIKPSNILVERHDDKSVPKVIDFGVAKATGELTIQKVNTRASQLIGMPMYMSPEQAASSRLDVDTRTDVYSLGVVLYELLIGTTPIKKEWLAEVGMTRYAVSSVMMNHRVPAVVSVLRLKKIEPGLPSAVQPVHSVCLRLSVGNWTGSS